MKETGLVIVPLTKEEFESTLDNRLEIAFQRFVSKQPARQIDEIGENGGMYVSKKEAARLISVCASTIDNHARAGHLTRHYIGKSVRFDRQQVLALAKRNQSHKQQFSHEK